MKTGFERKMADLLKAMAHPLRIRIIEVAARESHCQCELADLLDEHPVNINRHLNILIHADLVYLERKGAKTYPRIRNTEILEILTNLKTFMKHQDGENIREAGEDR
jgi:ArsR family transcriptional regulator